MAYERPDEPVLSWFAFFIRMLRHVGIATLLVGGGLAVGIAGYRTFAGLGWIDAFLNASMILTGMGPVDRLTTDAAKLFAGFYALFSGLLFVTAAGVIVSPLLHRVLHRFHLEADERGPGP